MTFSSVTSVKMRSPSECWTGFQEVRRVWAADVNGDGSEELLVMPGHDFVGSGGWWFFLYQGRGANWTSIASPWQEDQEGSGAWQTRRPRFDVLPRTRNGYHDLRIEIDSCLKWDDTKYVEYAPEDYRELSPQWFNAADNHEAEIFWAIPYSGRT